eukprot:EC715384.1.p1 GENE.EC715384.1~~EC715384.1.p1  ORF type:complete len:123 (-),score=3.23 EC715384.1:182-550(-)
MVLVPKPVRRTTPLWWCVTSSYTVVSMSDKVRDGAGQRVLRHHECVERRATRCRGAGHRYGGDGTQARKEDDHVVAVCVRTCTIAPMSHKVRGVAGERVLRHQKRAELSLQHDHRSIRLLFL